MFLKTDVSERTVAKVSLSSGFAVNLISHTNVVIYEAVW